MAHFPLPCLIAGGYNKGRVYQLKNLVGVFVGDRSSKDRKKESIFRGKHLTTKQVQVQLGMMAPSRAEGLAVHQQFHIPGCEKGIGLVGKTLSSLEKPGLLP
jgi:hypothetical protein